MSRERHFINPRVKTEISAAAKEKLDNLHKKATVKKVTTEQQVIIKVCDWEMNQITCSQE